MSNSTKKSFLVYYDNEIIVCRLSDDEAGKLFKSLFPYAKEQIKPDFENSPALAMAFDVLSMAIDRDSERYTQRCEKNRENIRKRWNKNNTNVYDCNKSNTKHTYKDRDKDMDRDMDRDRDKDMDRDMDKDRDKDMDRDRINYQQIADMYNNTCVSFPKVTRLSEARKKAIKARLNIYSLEDFQQLFTMAEESSFLKGDNNRNWSASFDWLIKDTNMAKVLDGNYADKPNSQNMQQDKPFYVVEEPEYLKYLNTELTPEEKAILGEE